MDQLDTKEILSKTTRYFIFGLVLAISIHIITKEILTLDQLLAISIVSALIYATMDHIL